MWWRFFDLICFMGSHFCWSGFKKKDQTARNRILAGVISIRIHCIKNAFKGPPGVVWYFFLHSNEHCNRRLYFLLHVSVFSSKMKLKAWPKHKFLVSYFDVVLGGIHQLRRQIFGYFWPHIYPSLTNVDRTYTVNRNLRVGLKILQMILSNGLSNLKIKAPKR